VTLQKGNIYLKGSVKHILSTAKNHTKRMKKHLLVSLFVIVSLTCLQVVLNKTLFRPLVGEDRLSNVQTNHPLFPNFNSISGLVYEDSNEVL
jgi:hypothetical protein